jgi:hypothetical protein
MLKSIITKPSNHMHLHPEYYKRKRMQVQEIKLNSLTR